MGDPTSARPAITEPVRSGSAILPVVDDLCRSSGRHLARHGLAIMGLACAAGLPGSEDVEPAADLARIREWAKRVAEQTPRYMGAFRKNPADFNHSEGYFRMLILVQVLKRDLGVHFNPERALPSDVASPVGFLDARDLFIHGPLSPGRAGTCNNIPMLVVAVARELGYPLYLACNAHHVYAIWHDADGHAFNIEASCPGGMLSHPDDHYRAWPHAMSEAQARSGCYLRRMTAVEELALCMVSRAWVLEANHRFAEAVDAYLHATSLWPAEPVWPRLAARCVGRWLRAAHNLDKPAARQIRAVSLDKIIDLEFDPRRLLAPAHAAAALAVLGRWYELLTKSGVATAMYAEAARLSDHDPRYVSCLIRAIQIAADEPRGEGRAVRPKAVLPSKRQAADDRFCLGLPLDFYTGTGPNPAVAARASATGDVLVALGRMAEAALAYGEAVRAEPENARHYGHCRWASRAFTSRQVVEAATRARHREPPNPIDQNQKESAHAERRNANARQRRV